MGAIDSIIVHCSATYEGQDIGAKEINVIHKKRGFRQIGYNYVIRLDGTVEKGRPLTIDGAHNNWSGFSGVSYNKHSIGICYIGGLDKKGKPKDTRTLAQKESLEKLIKELCSSYEIKEILGHRDTSPDTNGNGTIEPFEWLKACPCFDAVKEYKHLLKQ